MPIYEFECECGEQFDELVSINNEDCKGVLCPSCGSTKSEKLISNFAFQFGNPVGTDKWQNSHDYRFKHNLPNVLKQREAAERASKVGKQPYRKIDDVGTGKYFGEVK